MKKVITIAISIVLILAIVLGGIVSAFFAISRKKADSNTVIPSVQLKNLNDEQKAFIDSILKGAMEGYKKYKVLPSVTIGQAIIESGWGKSDLAIQGKNLFGIKADSRWQGATLLMNTNEEYGGHNVTEMALWRKYNSFNDSVEDHGKFLFENSRYALAGVFEAKNYREQITAIKNAGYATESDYVSIICGVIECYGLNALDGTNVSADSNTINNAIGVGRGLIGRTTYIFGAGRNDNDIAKGYFDCSSFIHYIFACSGVQLGQRDSVSTYSLIVMGTVVDKANLQPGDLIFFNTVGVNTHVGIYIGNGQFMHCSSSSGVVISTFAGYYESVFYSARRIVN